MSTETYLVIVPEGAGNWRADLACEGKVPTRAGLLRQLDDGRILIVPDRINLPRACTAIRASVDEAKAYLEPLAQTAKPRPARKDADGEGAAEPDLFSQS